MRSISAILITTLAATLSFASAAKAEITVGPDFESDYCAAAAGRILARTGSVYLKYFPDENRHSLMNLESSGLIDFFCFAEDDPPMTILKFPLESGISSYASLYDLIKVSAEAIGLEGQATFIAGMECLVGLADEIFSRNEVSQGNADILCWKNATIGIASGVEIASYLISQQPD